MKQFKKKSYLLFWRSLRRSLRSEGDSLLQGYPTFICIGRTIASQTEEMATILTYLAALKGSVGITFASLTAVGVGVPLYCLKGGVGSETTTTAIAGGLVVALVGGACFALGVSSAPGMKVRIPLT